MPDAIAVDPAFTAPERPTLVTQNIPVEEELAALLADRARLGAFLAHGYRLYRQATRRTWDAVETPTTATQPDGTPDPSFGQRSNEDARRAWLDLYQWTNTYGPTLLLLLDRGLLEGVVERDYRAAHAPDFAGAAPADGYMAPGR